MKENKYSVVQPGSDTSSTVSQVRESRDSLASRKGSQNRGTGRFTSTETDHFDTMMDTPTALRYASNSFHSDRSITKDGKKGKRGKNGSKLGN